ncbi:MAG: hypothetical protein U0Q55_13015 [Vicinamibacterales bacterium]
MPPACPNCAAGILERVPRSFVERFLYRKVLQCGKCGFRTRERRVPFEAEIEFATAAHTRCIQCGNLRVRRLPKRDMIDRMSTHPISLLAGLVRAPIYHCNPCRLQYHDWRPVHPSAMRERVMPGQPVGSDS